MIPHVFHLLDTQTQNLAHAPDLLRLAGQEVARASPRLIQLAGNAGREALRLQLALPAALRAFLLAWVSSIALQLAPPIGRRDWACSEGSVPSNTHWRDEAAWAGPSTAPPRVYIDFTDVLCHAIWHDTCAGIPRVQLEIASRLVRADRTACVIGWHRGRWCELGALIEAAEGDVDRVFVLLKETFSDLSWRPKALKLFLKRRRRRLRVLRHAGTPNIRSQDCLFIGGAFWVNRDVIQLCRAAAANGANLIVLFHDLIPLSRPSFCGHDFTEEYRAALCLPAHFIVTSELNRSELKRARQAIETAAGRVCSTIVPLADEFPGSRRGEPPNCPRRRLQMLADGDFALCVGTIEIRKNHHRLLGAWSELAAERGAAIPRLVIAGRRGWKAHATLMELDALAPDGPIVFIEAPSDDELRSLYASCLFTVFPSLFEGWGLPVGESFWFGKPCAASNDPSIAAVARDLCVSFSPHHSEDMKAAICRLLREDLRDEYRRRIELTRLRTWTDVAADIATIISERRPLSGALYATPDLSPDLRR